MQMNIALTRAHDCGLSAAARGLVAAEGIVDILFARSAV
jgi:hypothetical protein